MDAATLDHAVANIASRLGRGLSLEDLDGLLLAYSSHQETADRVRTNFLLSKIVPPDVSAWQLSHGIATAVRPVSVPANADLGMLGRVCVPLLARGYRVGYLWVLQGAHEESSAAILQELRPARAELDALAELLLNRTFAESSEVHGRGAQFLAACEGQPHAIDALLGWPAVHGRGPWRLATLVERAGIEAADVEQSRGAEREAFERGLLQRLSALQATTGIPGVLFAAGTDTHAVLLLSAAVTDADAIEILRRFGVEIARRGPHTERPDLMGLSEPFADLRLVASAYAQSKSAVQAAWVDADLGGVVAFRGIGVYQFLAVAGRDLARHESILFAELQELDRNGELVPVLELLYDTGGSVADVATALHLHRTSVYNRVARIRSLLGADPLAGPVRLELHLAMKAQRWAGRPRL
ncbi:PucR family transcriptional regulator [Cryobacterium frigoriphilum]|uniref:PucR family transcriptional regulator n=1 Tax=Cryobacterium frigoriphilum TaxID=1259150 RepID=A0A4R9A169_9MICO|nr:PucR family transcriptional regulator [Cryobacterium frigoriphilum]TFD50225.1 PucR family transcriptional regulator [Cryobacterium frigoriphilum]